MENNSDFRGTFSDEAINYPSLVSLVFGDTSSAGGIRDGEDPEAMPMYTHIDAASSDLGTVGM